MSAVEIAFFGSMCAKFFPTIEEGDMIQVRGYSVSVSKPEENDAGATEHLFFFEHESEGQVLHLPGTSAYLPNKAGSKCLVPSVVLMLVFVLLSFMIQQRTGRCSERRRSCGIPLL